MTCNQSKIQTFQVMQNNQYQKIDNHHKTTCTLEKNLSNSQLGNIILICDNAAKQI